MMSSRTPVFRAFPRVGIPLTVLPRRKDAWVVFAAGDLRIATFVTALRDALEPAVFAFLTHETPLAEGRS